MRSDRDPLPSRLPSSLPPLPLEVGPLKSSYRVWGSAVSSLSGVWGRTPKPKSNLVHFSLKIGQLVAIILMTFLRINYQVINFRAL